MAVSSLDDTELITTANVPQYSRIESAFTVPVVLDTFKEAQQFEALGIYLNYVPEKKQSANKKYGENHAKLATLIDLAEISSLSGTMLVSETCFGELFCDLKHDEKEAIAARLMFRIPIIQRILIDAADGEAHIVDYLKPFSESTKKRRLPNIRGLLELIMAHTTAEDRQLRSALGNVR